MERERVRVATTEGERFVEVIRRSGVWVFHRSPFYEYRHVVTHAPTGLAAYEGPIEVCRELVNGLGKWLPDWQADATWLSLRCVMWSPEWAEMNDVLCELLAPLAPRWMEE